MKTIKELRERRSDLKEILTRLRNEKNTATNRESIRLTEDAINRLDDEITRAEKNDIDTRSGRPVMGSDYSSAADAVRDILGSGVGSSRTIKPENPAAFYRSMITPEAGSAEKIIPIMTSSRVEFQEIESTAFLSRFNIITGVANHTTFPRVNSDQVITPQSQSPNYTGSLTEQSFSIGAFGLDYEAVHAYLAVHNDAVRDAATDLGRVILENARRGLTRELGRKVLYGGVNFSGLDTLGQQLDHGGAVVSDYTPFQKIMWLHEAKNYSWMNPALIVHPGVKYSLSGLVSATEGQPLQPTEQIRGLLSEANLYASTIIDAEGGVGDTKMFAFANPKLINVFLSPEYVITSVEKAMERDTTILMVTWRCYVNTSHPSSVVVVDNVRKPANIT